MKNQYKNQIFQNLLIHPLGIGNFQFAEQYDDYLVTYNPYDGLFKFKFIQEGNSFDRFRYSFVSYSPGFGDNRGQVPMNFDNVLKIFLSWIEKNIQPYIDDSLIPDLWSDYNKRIDLTIINLKDFNDFSNFRLEEKSQILLGLNNMKLLIADRFAQTQQQIDLVNNSINYLIGKVEELNKTDYKSIFISVVFGIIIALSLSPEQGKELMNLFLNIVRYNSQIGN